MTVQTDLNFNMRVAAGINDLKLAVHQCAVDHGWWENGDRNMGEMIALMHSELSEALEEYRDSEPYLYFRLDEPPAGSGMVGPQKWEGVEQLAGVLGKPEGLAAEFADVIIRILDTCERLDIPITRALIVKHNYNLTRPYRHGGKLA
jgi:diadenosine tetraphosphatase ApaH/serine/threonine PP2A family protein phosphatase